MNMPRFIIAFILMSSLMVMTGGVVSGGQDKVDICHITGTNNFGEGEIPIGHVITISESALEAHIKQGDLLTWKIVTLADGKEVCREPTSPPPGSSYPVPDKLYRKHVKDTLTVRFVVMADSHFKEDFGDNHQEHWVAGNIQETCDWLNDHECNGKIMGCTGIVSAGDMKSIAGSDFYGPIDQFRASYEKGYVDQDYNVQYPVYLGIGNHDDYTEFSTEWGMSGPEIPYTYVRDRMQDSPALFKGVDSSGKVISNYFEDNNGYSDIYAWEWGHFHFIHLGLWAFYDGIEHDDNDNSTRSSVNQDKVQWLKDHLAAIGKEKPIVLFQHFGWDAESLGQESGDWPTWWSTKNLELLGDVLCDRDTNEGESGPCETPYNVLGIFTGHLHDFEYHSTVDGEDKGVCGRGVYQISTKADERKWIRCDEYLPFANYVVDDAGDDTDKAGYFHVLLTLDGQGKGQMVVNKINLTNYSDGSYKRYAEEPWKVKDFTSNLFLRFDQGEPSDSGGNEDCALIKSNGRYNDYICNEKRRLLCKDENGSWHVSGGTYSWNEGFKMCEASGWQFTEPKSLKEQAEIIDTLKRNDVSEAWIDYADLGREGYWREIKEENEALMANFAAGEPDNGANRFEKGWGQNCVAIMRNGTLHDFPCEHPLNHYLCQSEESQWTVVNGGGRLDWKGGYFVCENDGVYKNFKGPRLDDEDAFQEMKSAASEYFSHYPDVSAIWVPINDLDVEDAWTIDQPWIATIFSVANQPGGWADNKPGLDFDKNCAVLGEDGWHDVKCDQPSESEPWYFACRNYETGEWKISNDIEDVSPSQQWVNGFEACRTLGLRWHFATPMRKDDNDELNTLRSQRGIERVWLNYTDAASDSGSTLEGFWRHGFWKGWMEYEPNDHNNQDCAAILGGDIGYYSWHDLDCDNSLLVFCRYNEDIYPWEIGEWRDINIHKTWLDALGSCPEGSLFAYPTCPSEGHHLQFKINQEANYWSPFNDRYYEGFFIPW